MRKLLVNGRHDDTLPVLDRGLQFGDGLFETLAVVDNRPCLWQVHLDRLRQGCTLLAIPMPDPALLRSEAEQLCAGQDRAVLKIILTRGAGGRGYRPPEDPSPNRVLMLADWPDHPAAWREQGVAVRHCRTRLGLNPDLAGIKHLNRLEQVMARGEWDDPAIAEGLLRDMNDRVIEGTASNLFLQRDDRLYTPVLDKAGVAGVMRRLVLDIAAAQGTPVIEQDLHLQDLQQADALYLTNSLVGVWAVRSLGERNYPRDAAWHPVMAEAMETAYGP